MENYWTPTTIFDARDREVFTRDGVRLKVKLYSDGWAIGRYEGNDIWTACRILNDAEAILDAA